MLLYIQYPDMERKWFKVIDFEDMNPIFAMFPNAQDIAMSCETVKEALDSIAEYLSSHHMTAWVEDADLSKSLRSKALALGLSLSTALNPTATSLKAGPAQSPPPVPTAHKEQDKNAFGTHPMDRFLWNLQQIESSGGKNTKHKPIASGKFKGTRAIGQWGLLKPSVDEMISRRKISGTLTPEIQALSNMSRNQLEEHFKKNPKVELDLARQLAEHVMARQKGNPHRAAFAWLHGHNLFPHSISQDALLHSDYVSKYKDVDRINPFKPKQQSVANIQKTQPQIDSSDFRMRVKSWFKRRENELTDEPTRSSNFQPDPGRLRDSKLDDVKPKSMMTDEEKIRDSIKLANKRDP